MRALLKPGKGLLTTQKRFREWKPRANTAIVQQLHNPPQQDPGYHPNPVQVAEEQVEASSRYYEPSTLKNNTLHTFLEKFTYEQVKNMPEQQVHRHVLGDDIYQYAQFLTTEANQNVFQNFVRDAGPLFEHLEAQRESLDDLDFRDHVLDMPDDIKRELEFSDKDKKELLRNLDADQNPDEEDYRALRAMYLDALEPHEQEYLKLWERETFTDHSQSTLELMQKTDFEDDKEDDEGDDKVDKEDESFVTWGGSSREGSFTPESVLIYLKQTQNLTLTPEKEQEILNDIAFLFEKSEGDFVQAHNRVREVVDEEFVRDTTTLFDEKVGVSSDMGDKMWLLHKQDPRLWTGERLGGLFGCDRDRAWAEICVREAYEAEETGKPFNYDKLEFLFNRGKHQMGQGHPNVFKFKTKYLTEEDAYKDFLKATETPSVDGGDDELPDWVALPFQQYRTLEKEDEIKTLPQPEKLLDLGNEKLKTRMLFVDFGKRLLTQPRQMKVKELDGTLRTASWAEQKHFLKHGKLLSNLKVGRGMKKKNDLKRRKRLF